MNTASSSGSRMLPSNTITNLKEDLKGITTRSRITYKGPTIPTTSSRPKVVEHEIKVTKDIVPPTNNEITKDVQPLVVQIETQVPNSEPVVAPVIKPVEAPVSAPRPNPKPSIPYPSRLNDQKLCKKANNQMEKFFQIFQDLNFNIRFANALILMPKFASTIKSFLTNKEKLFKLARTPLNEHCSVVLLKMLPEKLGDPGKFLIPCDFSRMDECLALADLGASINLMPLSIWKKLSLPELSPTCMTLELADRSISCPIGVTKHVSVKVGKFHFPADFDADPRVSLILGRSFLKIERALIDVYEGELTLYVGNRSVTFNVDQTSRYSSNYDAESINQIDVIDIACEEYSRKVFGFSEIDAFLAIKDEPVSSKIDDSYYDSEGDILLLEEFLNNDPSSPPLPPQELKVVEPKNEKSSIDKPPVVELKDLPPHHEYAFLEGDDKLPIIIAKDLKDEEKTALIKVLKSHKQALAWQLSDIKGINPEFYTHKILMEDDFKPAVQHQRRVNLKIHEVIKKEVLKLLDAGLIYPISDSPWVIPVHCVPKKGCFTVVENEENELIPTRLVTGWRVCIDYLKLNDATRKDHFPLPFMDQILERLAGNEYYCFLDGFSGYFQILIDPQDQEKTTFTCPCGMFSYRRMPFGLLCEFFDVWGIDFMGSFPSSRGNKYILVAVDYLPKWVEAKTLPTNDARVVFKFLKSLFARFGTPRAIISDRGTHFFNDQFAKVMLKYDVTHRLATAYHPQTSGQVEVSNHGLKRILERTIGANHASWSEKLDGALWAFRIAFKTPIGCTPYKLAYENSLIYKEKTKRINDSKIKDRVFKVGDRVFLFNSRMKVFSGKLKTRWTGLFTITQVFPYGTVELSQTDGPNFKVNGHTPKHYF
nr:reverse transcriptase domain-containing protein [Tanacetum cinerariifolium]